MRVSHRGVVGILAGALICGCVSAAEPTLFFEEAVRLEAGGVPIEIGSHAVTRLADWDADGDPDLLIGGGDGYVWLFGNSGSAANPSFEAGTKLIAGGSYIRAGTGYTGACFTDVTGDGLADLIVGYGWDGVCYYANVTRNPSKPVLTGPILFEGPAGQLKLPANCGGRIDVEDWDGDGLKDIIAGGFDGRMTLFRNDGSAAAPRFEEGVRLKYGAWEISWAYNIHPRVFDINQDGLGDLTYGINWGYFGFLLNGGTVTEPSLESHFTARNAAGGELNIRSLNADDTTPDYADLNGDGVLDIISGGKNGRVFVMYGIPYSSKLDRIEQIMQEHSADLGSALASNAELRKELFGLHHGTRGFVGSFLRSESSRRAVFDWYAAHVDRYRQYLKKRYLDTTVHTYVPVLAGQVWVNLLESLEDCREHRIEVAERIGLEGYHRDILVQFGTLFVENSRADTAQQKVVYDYLSLLPRQLWDCERITIGDFLGSGLPSEVRIEARSGVNIFPFRVGQYTENSFPSDSQAGRVDTYSIALAHEINHTVDAHTFEENEALMDRKYGLIEQASPADVIFRAHGQGRGVDWEATKAHFKSQRLWDGVESHWDGAWGSYWTSGLGKLYNDHWLRNNLKLMCEAPQEAFATLANQYFTSSEIMLDLALRRWNRGIKSCINQFLFCVDVYSCGGNRSYFYEIDTAGGMTRLPVCIGRNEGGGVNRLVFNNSVYEFSLDSGGDVTGVSGPVPFGGPAVDISPDCRVDFNDFTVLSASWPDVGCGECGGADLDGNSRVDFCDVAVLFDFWLTEPYDVPGGFDADAYSIVVR